MSVHIDLDQPHGCFTNLDFISGRVNLTLFSDSNISAINVKLEGESRTRLAGPRFPNDTRQDRYKTELELHKILYKVLTVFPTPSIAHNDPLATPQYTLNAGTYSYPFRFKFPFNNDCKNQTSVFQDLKFGQLNVQLGPETARHIKQTLPPSLGGFPGEAEIRYYVKATVVRPKFYQENLRYQYHLKFLPVEPIRPPKNDEETYARRQHQFQPNLPLRKRSVFQHQPDSPNDVPTSLRVDVRLPNPPVLTCHQPIPLRVLVERLNHSSATISLCSFQIELIGFTHIRAHDLRRVETGSWIIKSVANLDVPLDKSTTLTPHTQRLPSGLWDHLPLPDTVAPSFETCNIVRKYELEVRVGLKQSTSPELIVSSLRLPVKIFSGIEPPPELLRRMGHTSAGDALTDALPLKQKFTTDPAQLPPTPSTAFSPSQDMLQTASVGFHGGGLDDVDDLPPSYEDAMADDLAPVDGIRRDYEPPPAAPQTATSTGDSKLSGGLQRHPSERLFAQNAPRAPIQLRTDSSTAAEHAAPLHEEVAEPDVRAASARGKRPPPGDDAGASRQDDNVDDITQGTQQVKLIEVDNDGPALPSALERESTADTKT